MPGIYNAIKFILSKTTFYGISPCWLISLTALNVELLVDIFVAVADICWYNCNAHVILIFFCIELSRMWSRLSFWARPLALFNETSDLQRDQVTKILRLWTRAGSLNSQYVFSTSCKTLISLIFLGTDNSYWDSLPSFVWFVPFLSLKAMSISTTSIPFYACFLKLQELLL